MSNTMVNYCFIIAVVEDASVEILCDEVVEHVSTASHFLQLIQLRDHILPTRGLQNLPPNHQIEKKRDVVLASAIACEI